MVGKTTESWRRFGGGVIGSLEAYDRDRTGDLVLTKDVLYRLSYVGLLFKLKNPFLGVPVGAGDGNRTHVLSLEG